MRSITKNKYIYKSSLLLVGLVFLSACIEKETPVNKTSNNTQNVEIDFPLDAEGEKKYLNRLNGNDCYANIDCIEQDELSLVREFEFKRGQLILRGPHLSTNENDVWKINSHINIIAGESITHWLSTRQESPVHSYISTLSPFNYLNPQELNLKYEPKVLFQSRLGLPAHSYDDPGFCNLMEAENFISKSSSPWISKQETFSPDASYFGYNPQAKSYVAETVIVCGGFNILNSTITIEAKNIIFYNAQIEVSSDQDIPSGLKLIAENLGYFGKNVIVTNLVNSNTQRKASTVPTVDMSVSNEISFVDSNSPINNRFNEHSFNIFMGSYTEAEPSVSTTPNTTIKLNPEETDTTTYTEDSADATDVDGLSTTTTTTDAEILSN